MRKFLTVAGIIIAVIWVTNDPIAAAADVRHFIAAVTAFAHAL